MAVRVVQLGSPRAPGEGLRIGTVRRPPRGVPKADFGSRDFYDAWLPELSPSQALVSEALAVQAATEEADRHGDAAGRAQTDKDWARFVRAYRREMKEPAARHLLDLVVAMSTQPGADVAVGCYCDDPQRCHRSVLGELLAEAGAEVVTG